MDKYIMVLRGSKPGTDGCNYLSSVDKDGPDFSRDVDDAIVFYDKYRCVLFARGVTWYRPVDVYYLTEKVVQSYELIW